MTERVTENEQADAAIRFDTVVELGGKTATGFEVPAEVITALGSGRRPAVAVTLHGHRYRTTIGSMDGRAMIPLSAEHRTAAGLVAGDAVTVTIALDEAPRTVELPEDLVAALAAVPGAQEAFDRLAFSHRKEHVRSVVEAKKPETRDRRVAAVVAKVT